MTMRTNTAGPPTKVSSPCPTPSVPDSGLSRLETERQELEEEFKVLNSKLGEEGRGDSNKTRVEDKIRFMDRLGLGSHPDSPSPPLVDRYFGGGVTLENKTRRMSLEEELQSLIQPNDREEENGRGRRSFIIFISSEALNWTRSDDDDHNARRGKIIKKLKYTE